jgi:hypothetical protein
VLSRRQDLSLAAVEVVAIVIIAIAPVPSVPAVLLAVAAVALWIRGASFGGPPGAGPAPALLGLAVGAAALALSIALAAPLVEAMAGHAVEWAQEPAIRGNLLFAIPTAILALVGAVAAELAFRGWVAPRAVSLGLGPIPAIAVAAIAEAAVTRGPRLGAFVLALGLGALWAGSGRRLGAPLACRLVYELGALVLVAAGALD